MPSVFGSRSARIIVLVLALVAAACGSDPGSSDGTGSPSSGSIAALKADALPLSLLQAQSELTTGKAIFTFGLVSEEGQPATGGSPGVWISKDEGSPASGPFRSTYYEFTASKRFPNKSPKSALKGFFAAEVEIPEPGSWSVAAAAGINGRRAVGTGTIKVVAGGTAAPLGEKAPATPTPVAETEAGRRKICSRRPTDPLHYISLTDALNNGRPTVVVFSTPALCESRICGPVVDETLAVYEKVGRKKANFIHVEIYPRRDQPEPAPAFVEWGFQSEPWTILIDREGTIRARFEGPVVAPMIEAELQRLL